MTTSDVLTHLLRTVAMVFAGAAAFIAIIVGCILLGLPVWVMLLLLAGLLGAIIYGTARWHAYWAPVCRQAARIPWTSRDGVEMATVVEIAVVQAGVNSRTEIWRVSIYEQNPRRRRKRVMIGDSAEFLGAHNSGLWFFIRDGFHARRDGLVCVDLETGEWTCHVPRRDVEFVRALKKPRGLIEVEHRGVLKSVDLNAASQASFWPWIRRPPGRSL